MYEKKYSYMKQLTGSSKSDRININSYNTSVTAIRKENGKIVIEYSNDKATTKLAFQFLLMIFASLSLLKRLVILPLITFNVLNVVSYLIPAFILFFIMIICIVYIRESGGKEFLKNHAAEHMCIAACKKNRRLPTIKEISKFSRISSSCGISLFSSYITAQLIGFFIFIYCDFMIWEIILFILPIFLHRFFPFNIISKIAQFFTTKKPEIHNLELALAAITALNDKEISNKTIYDTTDTEFDNN